VSCLIVEICSVFPLIAVVSAFISLKLSLTAEIMKLGRDQCYENVIIKGNQRRGQSNAVWQAE